MKKNEERKIHFLTCFGFLNKARTQPHSFGRHLVGMLRMGLPQLPKQLRHQNNNQKYRKHMFTSFTSFNTKIDIKYFLSRFVLAYYFPIFLCGTAH